MAASLFTIISEFGGTTNVTQTTAEDVTLAVRKWAQMVRSDAPFGVASAAVGEALERALPNERPTPIEGAQSVWCVSALCGDALLLAHIVETVRA
jgi:hypothetical protein